MNDGFFHACIASIILSGLCIYVFSDLKKPTRHDPLTAASNTVQRRIALDMSKSGCLVIGYAGARADIKVYRCPGYGDVVTERDWQGPRTVEKR
jgi:hypothetical protein